MKLSPLILLAIIALLGCSPQPNKPHQLSASGKYGPNPPVVITITQKTDELLSSFKTQSFVKLDVIIPVEFIDTISPNGEPDSDRYRRAYEAFWWNYIAVNANNMQDRIPFTCNGSPSAVNGAAKGAEDAMNQVQYLLEEVGEDQTQAYLIKLAHSPEAKQKMIPYFNGQPKSDKHGF